MLVTMTLRRGMKPTAEQLARIYANAPKSDDEIDLSDIPETTHEEFVRARERQRRKKNLKIAG